jgi:hypothetical protein
MGRDRRRYHRVGVALNVTVEAAGGQWSGKTADLSPYGVKVRVPTNAARVTRGAMLRLRIALADGDAPLLLAASVVRTDRDGLALNFANLEDHHFERLKAFVDLLLESLPPRPMKDRRRGPRTDVELEVSFEAEKPYDWRGKTVNLSPFGVKVALPASAIRPSEGTSLQLRLGAPDDGPTISLKGMIWRREPKSTALIFVELNREELERVRTLVESLHAQPV